MNFVNFYNFDFFYDCIFFIVKYSYNQMIYQFFNTYFKSPILILFQIFNLIFHMQLYVFHSNNFMIQILK